MVKRSQTLIKMASSGLAIATALTGQQALAQAYQGSPTVASGTVNFDRTSPGQDFIDITSPTAVIDWTPDDVAIGGGAIDFLPSGTAVAYSDGNLGQDYTVLNRIVPNDPARPVALNGTIVSNVTLDPMIGQQVTGGNVWFYSPGGLLIGANADIDVGGLLLATGDPTGGGPSILDENQFAISSGNSDAFIAIEPGAQISAFKDFSFPHTSDAYIAVVAPVIYQDGNVQVDGSVAYVAAEQTTLTFSTGLFDIQTTVGTNGDGSDNALSHSGSTEFTSDGIRRAYLVAVPKNEAITMTILGSGGNLGFDPMAGATVSNGVVYLLGAADIISDTPQDTLVAGFDTQISILGEQQFNADLAIYNQKIFGSPNESVIFSPFPGSTITAFGDVDIHALNTRLDATGGNIDITGNLDIDASLFDSGDFNVTGGTVNIIADASVQASLFQVGGDLTINADGSHSFPGFSVPGTASGGTIMVSATDGGQIIVDGNLTARAQGVGADQLTTGQPSNAIGGSVQLTSSGILNIGGTTMLDATAFAGNASLAGTAGATATGGQIDITLSEPGSAITFTGNLTADAAAIGGSGIQANGGDALAGIINITSTGGNTLTSSGNTTLRAIANGGDAVTSGQGGSGGGTDQSITISVADTGGLFNFDGNLVIQSDGVGGNGVGGTATGGLGEGGMISLLSATSGTISITNDTDLSAVGLGGNGAGGGGQGDGGLVALVSTQSGNISGNGAIDFKAIGQGGAGSGGAATGGLGNGGAIDLISYTDGTINLAAGGPSEMRADGRGGQGGAAGGVGNGGFVTVRSGDLLAGQTGGDINIGTVRLFAQGNGGQATAAGGSGGTAMGGTVDVVADNGGLIIFTDYVGLDTFATGGDAVGANGNGGDATGGNMLLRAINNGTVETQGLAGGQSGLGLSMSGIAQAGRGNGAGFSHGDAAGGIADIVADSGGGINLALGSTVIVRGDARQASGAPDSGGAGQGGSISITVDGGGAINGTAAPTLLASGLGSDGVITGGAGTGGGINVGILDGTMTFTGTGLSVAAVGVGGNGGLTNGGTGGDGFGGEIFMTVGNGTPDPTTQLNLSNLAISASPIVESGGAGGLGGNGDTGGVGQGGSVNITADGGVLNVASNISIVAGGNGGNAIGDSGTPPTVGVGGDGLGGGINLFTASGGQIIGTTNVQLTASGAGGGGAGSGGAGVGGVIEIGAFDGLINLSVGGPPSRWLHRASAARRNWSEPWAAAMVARRRAAKSM